MWIRIVVFTLLTVVIARDVHYTDEDARRDILSIINYAFGHKTNGRLRERTDPEQLRLTGNSENNGKRAKTFQTLNNESKNSRTNTHKHIDIPIEVNYDQRSAEPTKTPPRSNHARGRETFRDVKQRESVNSSTAIGFDRSQGRSNLSDLVHSNGKQTKLHIVNNKIYTNEPNPSTVPMNKLYTTPASDILASTIKNVAKSSDRDIKRNKIEPLNNLNVVSNRVQGNQTENILQHVVTVKNKTVTVKPQSNWMKPDEDRWIWDDGTMSTTTASTTPYVDDRAAFAADKCPTGQVKFGDKCVEED